MIDIVGICGFATQIVILRRWELDSFNDNELTRSSLHRRGWPRGGNARSRTVVGWQLSRSHLPMSPVQRRGWDTRTVVRERKETPWDRY